MPIALEEAEKAMAELRSLKSWMDDNAKMRREFEKLRPEVETKPDTLEKDEDANSAAGDLKTAKALIARALKMRDDDDYGSALKALKEATKHLSRAEVLIAEKRKADTEARERLKMIKSKAATIIESSHDLLAKWGDTAWVDHAAPAKNATAKINICSDEAEANAALNTLTNEIKWLKDHSASRRALDDVEKELSNFVNGLSPSVRNNAPKECANAESCSKEAKKLRDEGKYSEAAGKCREAISEYGKAQKQATEVEKKLKRVEKAKTEGADSASAIKKYNWDYTAWKTKTDFVETKAAELKKCDGINDVEKAEALRDKIAEALEWAKENDAICREIVKLEPRLAELDAEAQRVGIVEIDPDSDTVVKYLQEQIVTQRKDGKFAEVKKNADLAISTLETAISKTKKKRAENAVQLARTLAAEGKWRECFLATNVALEYDPGNEEAQALKEKAEKMLHPPQ